MTDKSVYLCEQVLEAIDTKSQLNLVGGNSKHFMGRAPTGKILNIGVHHGIVDYQPLELVITARAGTSVSDINSLLAENNQQLAFEPAELKGKSTLGGVLATNNSGSSRPFWGSARDSVLGVKLINGLGQHLTFGGQVMKNVAGYDVSRLQAGAMGTLGILSEISLRVMPIPECELTLVKETDAAEALIEMRKITRQPHPISGLTWHKGVMYTRLSGTRNSVREAERQLGGDAIHDKMFWNEIREFQLLKTNHRPVYRLSVAPDAPLFHAIDKSFIDWAGGLRWLLNTDEQFDTLCSLAEKYGGHASLYSNRNGSEDVFHPLPQHHKALHQRVRDAFDPYHVFTPGRLYSWLN